MKQFIIDMKNSLRYLLLLFLATLSVAPFLWLLSTAFKGSSENIFAYPPHLIPTHPTLNNFWAVWQKVPMGAFFLNSSVVTGLTILGNLVLSVLAAYPLARMRFKGQKIIFFSILATMMIPFQALMIPLYLICLKLNLTDNGGLVNSWLGLTLPFAFSGFGVFFIRQALVVLPKELEEAAVLDGCNSLQVLWHILLPMIRPALASLAIFAFIAAWGEFLWPSVILSNPAHFTLPVGLVQLQSAFSTDWKLISAGAILSMIPILVFFIALQRYFIPDLQAGSVKG